MRRPALLCAATLVLGPAPALADDAATWLLQISDAARQANYQGVVIFRDRQHMEVMRLVHRHQEGRVNERLTSLTGRPRDILREDDRVAAVVGDEPVQSAAAQDLFPFLSKDALAQAALHYETRDLGIARVAGRTCRGVIMAPRDEFRYGYEICGDTQTAVPLRVTLLDRLGRTVEQLMFTEITFPERIADAAFTPPPNARLVQAPGAAAPPAVATTAAAAQAEPPESWRVATLPPGFRVVRRAVAPSPDGTGFIEHVLLSDGVSAVSVFGVRSVSDKALRGLSNMGAMNIYGRRVGGFHITVVGEVPSSTVRMIGEGLAMPPTEPDAAPAAPDPVP
ncbi:MAG: MucB/RseB C-terminal domain-containing protein [Gammaproteobacteria bacterium]